MPHMGWVLVFCIACSSSPARVSVAGDPGLPAPILQALKDISDDVVATGTERVSAEATDNKCESGRIKIIHEGIDTSMASQAISIQENRCSDGKVLRLKGGSLLAAQWAAYDLMERLGVSYFHPEQTFYPKGLQWPRETLSVEASPSFPVRSLHVHRHHPVELKAPLNADSAMMATIQKRWIDWNVKIKNNEANGFDESFVGDYAYARGFPRIVGFAILSVQQGDERAIDPNDPRPEVEQLKAAIDRKLADVPGLPQASVLLFTFNESEFSEADEELTIQRLEFVSTYVRENYPGVSVRTINHGTKQNPSAGRGVRFFDLSQFAPANLEVEVHPLMFYDLERKAPNIYGNQDFIFLRDWIMREQDQRRLHYFPESSWWLTFDLPVPLFLAPVSIEARAYDMKILAPMLAEENAAKGVVGHRTFTSGQEWGYWLIDYCTSKMTWDVSFTHTQCFESFAKTSSEPEEVVSILNEVTARQIVEMRNELFVGMMTGTDDETEAAEDIGIVFHPLAPRLSEARVWSGARVQQLQQDVIPMLKETAVAYQGYVTRLEALLAETTSDKPSNPWILELRDGLAMYGLRAAHAASIYEGAIELRGSGANALANSKAALETAEMQLDQAKVIVARRETSYRYDPSLTIVGDEIGTMGAIPNGTTYPYRYLSRLHRLFYWNQRNQALGLLIASVEDQLALSTNILPRAEALSIQVGPSANITDVRTNWGDGQMSQDFGPHMYSMTGVYTCQMNASRRGTPFQFNDRVAVVDEKMVYAKGSVKVLSPNGIALIEGLLPGLVMGTAGGSSPFLAVAEVSSTSNSEAVGTLATFSSPNGGVFPTAPQNWTVNVGSVGSLTVFDAVFEQTLTRRAVSGKLRTADVIALLVSTGGFDEEGAKGLVASLLGFTPESLPTEVPLVLGIGG